jgi:predicted RNA-binding protein YlqC (UPF0109 family)
MNTTQTDSDTTQGTDRDFIEYLVKQIVDEPDAVEVTRRVDDLGVLITLRVGPNDMGKVIGKSGQTAKALRTLLRVVGSKFNLRVNLKIVEPDGSEVMVRDETHNGGHISNEGGLLEEDLVDKHASLDDDLKAA